MSKLTPRQENFCLAYIKTGNASEAYRQSYNAENYKPESVHRLAKAMLDNVKIESRISDLRRPAVEAAQMTLKGHLIRLDELSRAAEKADQFSAAITAETNRGKAAGLYEERVKHDGEISINVRVSFE